MSRREHQAGGLKLFETVENYFFFRCMSAGCENQRHSRSQTKTVSNLHSLIRQLPGKLSIKLKIPCGIKLLIRHAERPQPLRVSFRLHDSKTQTRQHSS